MLRTLEREGKAVTNFDQRLPKPQSDLARATLKDPYRFDFLSLGSEAEEREIEAALVTHITEAAMSESVADDRRRPPCGAGRGGGPVVELQDDDARNFMFVAPESIVLGSFSMLNGAFFVLVGTTCGYRDSHQEHGCQPGTSHGHVGLAPR